MYVIELNWIIIIIIIINCVLFNLFLLSQFDLI
jgi:hypothetical protein